MKYKFTYIIPAIFIVFSLFYWFLFRFILPLNFLLIVVDIYLLMSLPAQSIMFYVFPNSSNFYLPIVLLVIVYATIGFIIDWRLCYRPQMSEKIPHVLKRTWYDIWWLWLFLFLGWLAFEYATYMGSQWCTFLNERVVLVTESCSFMEYITTHQNLTAFLGPIFIITFGVSLIAKLVKHNFRHL